LCLNAVSVRAHAAPGGQDQVSALAPPPFHPQMRVCATACGQPSVSPGPASLAEPARRRSAREHARVASNSLPHPAGLERPSSRAFGHKGGRGRSVCLSARAARLRDQTRSRMTFLFGDAAASDGQGSRVSRRPSTRAFGLRRLLHPNCTPPCSGLLPTPALPDRLACLGGARGQCCMHVLPHPSMF
jgi:hypothetical protein